LYLKTPACIIFTDINKFQQDATVCSFLFIANNSTCFGRLSQPSSGVHQTVNAVLVTQFKSSRVCFSVSV